MLSLVERSVNFLQEEVCFGAGVELRRVVDASLVKYIALNKDIKTSNQSPNKIHVDSTATT